MSVAVSCARIADVILGDGPVKVITPLVGRTEAELLKELTAAQTSEADLIEWRADYFETATQAGLTSAAMALRSHTVKPILLTLRTAREGGELSITDEDYGGTHPLFCRLGICRRDRPRSQTRSGGVRHRRSRSRTSGGDELPQF